MDYVTLTRDTPVLGHKATEIKCSSDDVSALEKAGWKVKSVSKKEEKQESKKIESEDKKNKSDTDFVEPFTKSDDEKK